MGTVVIGITKIETIEAAFQAGFEPSEESSQNNDLIFIEAQEYLTNEAIRY